MQDFRQLQVWQKAHALTLSIYRATADFPTEEKYGLVSQMRRSASSIPTNLAEGCGREGQRELARYTEIARGSASELEYQLLLARDLGFMTDLIYHQLNAVLTEVQKMLVSFRQSITSPTHNSRLRTQNS